MLIQAFLPRMTCTRQGPRCGRPRPGPWARTTQAASARTPRAGSLIRTAQCPERWAGGHASFLCTALWHHVPEARWAGSVSALDARRPHPTRVKCQSRNGAGSAAAQGEHRPGVPKRLASGPTPGVWRRLSYRPCRCHMCVKKNLGRNQKREVARQWANGRTAVWDTRILPMLSQHTVFVPRPSPYFLGASVYQIHKANRHWCS